MNIWWSGGGVTGTWELNESGIDAAMAVRMLWYLFVCKYFGVGLGVDDGGGVGGRGVGVSVDIRRRDINHT